MRSYQRWRALVRPLASTMSRTTFTRGAAASALATIALTALSPALASATVRAVAPGGADGGPCTGAPCGSLRHAHAQAAAGDVIELATGRYGAQQLDPGVPVEIRPAAGAAVALGSLNIAASGIVVRDIATGFLDLDGPGTVANVTVIGGSGPGIWMQDVRDILIAGGSYGGNFDKPTVQIDGNPGSSGITFDGVDFHDAVATNDSVHMECIWAGGVQGFTVRNSIFRNCAYFDIFFTRLNGPDPRDVLLESNVFEAPKQSSGADAPYAVNISNSLSRAENFTLRNNTFAGDLTIQPTGLSNVQITGNLGRHGSCHTGASYAGNVWTTRRCAPTDTVAAAAMSQFVDPANHDWHLIPDATAIDKALPSASPLTDRDRKARVGVPDAGAHEFGTPPAPSAAPGGGDTAGGLRLRSARLTRARICRRARRRCRATTVLALELTRDARVTVRISRRGRAARRLRARTRGGALALRIGPKGLARGRYRVRATAVDGPAKARSRALRLRVR